MIRIALGVILLAIIIVFGGAWLLDQFDDDGPSARDQMVAALENGNANRVDNVLEDHGFDDGDIEDVEEAIAELVAAAQAAGADTEDVLSDLADEVSDLDNDFDSDDLVDAIHDVRDDLVRVSPPTTPTANPTQAPPPNNNNGGTKADPTTAPDNSPANVGMACQEAVSGAKDYPGPTTAEVKAAIGVDVQRIGTECSAFVWRGTGAGTENPTCASGYICTFDVVDVGVRVYQGNGQTKQVNALTVRWVDAYPDYDKVHRPCELLASEYGFGVNEVPDFQVFMDNDSNFSCGGASQNSSASAQSAPVVAATTEATEARSCPASAAEAAAAIGTSGGNWRQHSGTQWVWEGSGLTSALSVPAGYSVDYDGAIDGIGHAEAGGAVPAGAVVFTLNCVN